MSISKDVEDSLENMSTEEKMDTLRQVISDPTYSGGSYAEMMKDIMRSYECVHALTNKQLSAVTVHLQKNWKIWY